MMKDAGAYKKDTLMCDCGRWLLMPVTFEDEDGGWESPELACVECEQRLGWADVGGVPDLADKTWTNQDLVDIPNPKCGECQAKAKKAAAKRKAARRKAKR